MRKTKNGFSLIELLIVIAIILIIAAIAIPNLLRSKMAADETSAVNTMRTLNTSAVSYTTTYGSFPASLANLGPMAPGTSPSSTAADLVSSIMAVDPAKKAGYTFVYTPAGSPATTYSIMAVPMNPGVTGQRGFYTDQTGVIRADPGGSATASSTPVS